MNKSYNKLLSDVVRGTFKFITNYCYWGNLKEITQNYDTISQLNM